MMKKLQFNYFDKKTNKVTNSGYMSLSLNDSFSEIYIYGDICMNEWDKGMPEDVCPQDIVNFLSEIPSDKPLKVYINSGGGSVYGAKAISNIIERHKGETIAHVDGLAASAASYIAFSCDRIVVPSTSQIMIHKPITYAYGNVNDFRKSIEILDGIQESMLEAYMKKALPATKRESINEMIENETWMCGKQVAEYFDVEVEERADVAACACSEYFSSYKNTPDIVLKSIHQNHTPENNGDEKSSEINLLKLELDFLRFNK